MAALAEFASDGVLRSASAAICRMRANWLKIARPKQLTPNGNWGTWLVRSGRGFGKTRLGAEDVAWYGATHPGVRIAVVAPTYNDARFTCFEGESGILSILPPQCIKSYNSSFPFIVLWNGTTIWGYSATKPARLRGPQFHRAWCDELAAWDRATMDEAWDNLMFGLRLGADPQVIVTTTPRPVPLVRKLCKGDRTVVTTGSTYENRDNLAKTFFDRIIQYEGTVIGRQEIHGELIDPEETGIIKRSWLQRWPMPNGVNSLPLFSFIILSLDTAFTDETYDEKKGEPDFSAGSVLGVFTRQIGVERVSDRIEKPKYRNHVMLLDAWRDHLGFPELVTTVRKEMKRTYGAVDKPHIRSVIHPIVPSSMSGKGRDVDLLVIEDKGAGISLRQEFSKHKIFMHPYNPGNADKMARMHIVSHIPHAGLVWVPESISQPGKFADWAEPWIEEICTFPNSDFFDWADTFSQGLRVMSDKGLLSVIPPQTMPDNDNEPVILRRGNRRKNPYGR